MSEDLYNKVEEAEPNLVFCTWEECKNRGEYIRCYFDLYKMCPKYSAHQNYLKTVREMKVNKKYKIRHHPRRK